jgi:hypothetical protein
LVEEVLAGCCGRGAKAVAIIADLETFSGAAAADPLGRCVADRQKEGGRWFAAELKRHKGSCGFGKGVPRR